MCRQLTDHFSKELCIPAHYTENLYEEVTYRISANELRTAMGSDVVVTGASGQMIKISNPMRTGNGSMSTK